MLKLVLAAIHAGTPFERVTFPNNASLQAHPDYRLGPLPMYFCAEIVEGFERDHLLRARDHARWYAIYDRMMAALNSQPR